MTRWRVLDLDGWAFDGPQVTLTYDADDDETVSIIEAAAEGAGVLLERIDDDEGGNVREPRRPSPDSPGDAIALEKA